MSKQELENYYPELLIVQYKNKPKAKEEIKLLAKTAAGDFLIKDVETCFDLDAAIGQQLDYVGKIIGLPRIVYGFDFGATTYFSMDDEANPMTSGDNKGFSDIGDKVEAEFKDYSQIISSIYSMTDEEYRLMLKLKVLINNGIASEKYICEEFQKIFGGTVILASSVGFAMNFYAEPLPAGVGLGFSTVDNPVVGHLQRPMEMDILVYPAGAFYARLANYAGLLPSPVGVQKNIYYL